MLEAVWAHEEAPLVRHLGCFRDADMGGGKDGLEDRLGGKAGHAKVRFCEPAWL